MRLRKTLTSTIYSAIYYAPHTQARQTGSRQKPIYGRVSCARHDAANMVRSCCLGACPIAGFPPQSRSTMNRPKRRLHLPWLAVSVALLLAPVWAAGAAPGGVPPEKTYSNTPYFHRIQLRDVEGNVINGPTAAGKDDPGGRPFSLAMTCGKCHDYPAMSHGWHFN